MDLQDRTRSFVCSNHFLPSDYEGGQRTSFYKKSPIPLCFDEPPHLDQDQMQIEVLMRQSEEISETTNLSIPSKCCPEIREELKLKIRILSGLKVKLQRVWLENLKLKKGVKCLKKKLAEFSESRKKKALM
jgi:hypothetical protein